MPSKYVIRDFSENSNYHILNRGIDRRTIFQDEKDYEKFLEILSVYLIPQKELSEKGIKIPKRLEGKNLSDEVALISFCLILSEFHLVLHQTSKDGISKLLKQLSNAYTRYFNEKYDRHGALFEGRYRAVKVDNGRKLLLLSRHLHLKPVRNGTVGDAFDYPWSSHKEYVKTSPSLVNTSILLEGFPSFHEFNQFMQNHYEYDSTLAEINDVRLE